MSRASRFFCYALMGCVLCLGMSSTAHALQTYKFRLFGAKIAPRKASGSHWDLGWGKSKLPDVVVTIEIGGQRLVGKKIKNTLEPEWEVERTFVLGGREAILIRVFDKDLRSDDLIGQKKFFLYQFPVGKRLRLSFGQVLRLEVQMDLLSAGQKSPAAQPLARRAVAPTPTHQSPPTANPPAERPMVRAPVEKNPAVRAPVEKAPAVVAPRVEPSVPPTPEPKVRVAPMIPAAREAVPSKPVVVAPRPAVVEKAVPPAKVEEPVVAPPVRRSVPAPVESGGEPVVGGAPAVNSWKGPDACPTSVDSRLDPLAWYAAAHEFLGAERRVRKRYELRSVRAIERMKVSMDRWGSTLFQRFMAMACYKETNRRGRTRCFVQRVKISRRKPNGVGWSPWQIIRLHTGKKVDCGGLKPLSMRTPGYSALIQKVRGYHSQLASAWKRRVCPPSFPGHSVAFKAQIKGALERHFEKAQARWKKQFRLLCFGVTHRVWSKRIRRGRLLTQTVRAVDGYHQVWKKRNQEGCYVRRVKLTRKKFPGMGWMPWSVSSYAGGKSADCKKLR